MKFRSFLLLLLCAASLMAAPESDFKVGNILWKRYSRGQVTLEKSGVFTIVDRHEKFGAGISCILPVSGRERYGFSGEFKALPPGAESIFIQVRYLPRKKIYQQKFALKAENDFKQLTFTFPPPPVGCDSVQLYIYVQPGQSSFKVRNIQFDALKQKAFDPAAVKARPDGMVLDKDTLLVLPNDGSGDELGNMLRKTCRVDFQTATAGKTARSYRNAVIIGNRNNNQLISDLYDRYHLIADSYYPGRGGYQVRTLLDPQGDGKNYLLLSGSDEAGTAEAVKKFIGHLSKFKCGNGQIKVPFFWDVKLSGDYQLPKNIVKAHTFDESEGYGTRMFGWNVLARYMALFYATGDPAYARRFLKLAFPADQDARSELARDPGAFKLTNEPLAGPYHYNSVMANLYWAMIENHPVFSEEERLKVAEAMFKQFLFWRDTSNGSGIYRFASPAAKIGNRHQQWAAISLYTVGRYLNKIMPSAEYVYAQQAAENHFASIKKYAYVEGEGGNLTWYPSGIEPVPLFMLLAGWKNDALQSGLHTLYCSLETLCGNSHGRRIRQFVPLSLLRRMAYLLDNNAPLEFEKRLQEHFRSNVFRLGQSFAPAGKYSRTAAANPGCWNFFRPSTLEQRVWNMPFKDTGRGFNFASYRADEKDGDLLIIDGHLDRIMRQPLHAMCIFTLTLNKLPLLAGYRNQLWARHDGLSFSSMPGSAHFDCSMSLSNVAGFAASLPAQDTLMWQRSLLKVNNICLIADTLTEKGSRRKLYSIDNVWEHAPDMEQHLQDNGQLRLLDGDLRRNSCYFFDAGRVDYSVEPAAGETVLLASKVRTVLFKAQAPGEKLQINFKLPQDFAGPAQLLMYAYRDRGQFKVSIDGQLIKEQLSHYSRDAQPVKLDLGTVTLKAGSHVLTLENLAPEDEEGLSIAFSALALGRKVQMGNEGSLTFSVPSSVRLESHKAVDKDMLSGKVTVYSCQADLQPQDPQSFFTLAAALPAGEVDCKRLDKNAALLKMPEKALAVQGNYEPWQMQGQLLLCSKNLLCGMQMTSAGELFSSDVPVDVKWDFPAGKLEIFTEYPAEVTAGGMSLQLQKGINKFAMKLPGNMLQKLARELDALRPVLPETAANAGKLQGRERKSIQQLKLGAYPANMITINGNLAVTAGKIVKLFDRNLQLLRTFEADSPVGKVAFVPQGDLLLAGCEDGKVIAYDLNSAQRRWEHLSQEADGLSETGAHWYLKSAFPGIYGVSSGRFIDGKVNIFVGSASTLEVLDLDGKLLRREKIFWGPVQHFALFDVNGQKRLAMSQLYPGGDYLTCFDTAFNKKLACSTPPPGRLHFPSWMGINRTGIMVMDLDKDGQNKIVCGLNGVWNRIIVWDINGKPLREVSFGPGDSLKVPPYGRERMEKRFLNDVLAVETATENRLVAVTAGALIMFDRNLQKIWSRPLPSDALVNAVWGSKIVCGMRNGQLCFFDLNGDLQYLCSNSAPWAAIAVIGNELFAADSKGVLHKFK